MSSQIDSDPPDLGADSHARDGTGLDLPFAITYLEDFAAKALRLEMTTLRALAPHIRDTTAPAKAALPWLKLARFGTIRTDALSLRHDSNVLAVSGLEADYDGGQMSIEDAVAKLIQADVLAMVYTSPSHSEDMPRWRILCPFSTELPAHRREKVLGRLNGLFAGILAGESWTLSQAFYYGSVRSNPSHTVELIDGQPIDTLDELDEIWTGKPATTTRTTATGERVAGPMDEEAVLAEITSGTSYHASAMRLLGKWATSGVSLMEARRRLFDAFDLVFPGDRDDRWNARRADVDRCLLWVFGKQAEKADQQDNEPPPQPPEPPPEPPADDDPGFYTTQQDDSPGAGRRGKRGKARQGDGSALAWPTPLDFLATPNTDPPHLRPDHVPPALWGFATDTAERMGVDAAGVALCCIVTCCAVCTDDWQIQPKANDWSWTEAPRLWGAIVGDPSILKTPVISAATKPIDRLDMAAREKYGEEMRAYRAAAKLAKDDKSGNAAAPDHPRLDRYVIENATVEALSEALRDDLDAKQRAPQRKLLVRQDEMSEFLGNLDRYRAGGNGSGDRGVYLRLYNGGRHSIDRILRGSFVVPNWSACFLGGIQPGPLQKAAKEAADDGLLQRFLFCVPGPQRAGEDRAPAAAARSRYNALIPALAALHPPRGRDGEHFAPVVLHRDAHQHRDAVKEMATAMMLLPDTSAQLKAALGKWDGQFARLALVFHLIDVADAHAVGGVAPFPTVVPEATARRARDFMLDIVLPHLLRAHAVMYATELAGHARWVAGFVLAQGADQITTRDVVRAYRALRPPECRDELEEVLASLVVVGWLEPIEPANPVGRVTTWMVNPQVHALFAERAEEERERRDAARAALDALVQPKRA